MAGRCVFSHLPRLGNKRKITTKKLYDLPFPTKTASRVTQINSAAAAASLYNSKEEEGAIKCTISPPPSPLLLCGRAREEVPRLKSPSPPPPPPPPTPSYGGGKEGGNTRIRPFSRLFFLTFTFFNFIPLPCCYGSICKKHAG